MRRPPRNPRRRKRGAAGLTRAPAREKGARRDALSVRRRPGVIGSQTLLRMACAHASPWLASIALLALSLVRAPPWRRRPSLLQLVRMLPRRSKFGAVALSALIIVGLTVTPYLHAPRDMPMIAWQGECGCAAPVLYGLVSHMSCHRQDGGIDPFGRILLAKGLGDATAMTEYILAAHSARYLACLIRDHARAFGGQSRRAAR